MIHSLASTWSLRGIKETETGVLFASVMKNSVSIIIFQFQGLFFLLIGELEDVEKAIGGSEVEDGSSQFISVIADGSVDVEKIEGFFGEFGVVVLCSAQWVAKKEERRSSLTLVESIKDKGNGGYTWRVLSHPCCIQTLRHSMFLVMMLMCIGEMPRLSTSFKDKLLPYCLERKKGIVQMGCRSACRSLRWLLRALSRLLFGLIRGKGIGSRVLSFWPSRKDGGEGREGMDVRKMEKQKEKNEKWFFKIFLNFLEKETK